MGITKSIGKNTLGGGNKMNVDLRTYNRSTHNLSRIFRSSMGVGTLVPCLVDIALPGDTWDMNIMSSVLTLPTVGPLFGKYKLQVDVFTAPFRLYVSELHNNKLGVGLDMSKVRLPQIRPAIPEKDEQLKVWNPTDKDPWTQVNPSSLLSYLGIKGWGKATKINDENAGKPKCGLPMCSYWDIVKNYYINKQESKFHMIGESQSVLTTGYAPEDGFILKRDNTTFGLYAKQGTSIIFFNPNKIDTKETVIQECSFRFKDLKTEKQTLVPLADIVDGTNVTMEYLQVGTAGYTGKISFTKETFLTTERAYFVDVVNDTRGLTILLGDIAELDKMRDQLLKNSGVIFSAVKNQYNPGMIRTCLEISELTNKPRSCGSQYGLAIKTHQSDIFNNWVNTDWIDGENGINAITAIDTSSGEFTIDQFNLAKKVYDMLNRIAVSGGTYKDWVETVYTTDYITHTETPVYEGGMSADVEFQEVVSTAATEAEALGTLAGRGRMTNPRNGKLKIKVSEPSVIMAIASLTPYCDYSMGDEWYNALENMNDLHMPQLDGIGFQDLTLNKMAWFASEKLSAGKQPAWIDYMTSFNRCYGEFAARRSMDFMVLQRHYEGADKSDGSLNNVTSYINPKEFNYIFADTELDAQNFWVQIGFRIEARRVMSAKQIPNL